MTFSIRNADTNEPIPLEHGKPIWRPIGVHQASAQTWKWSLFIPHLVRPRLVGADRHCRFRQHH